MSKNSAYPSKHVCLCTTFHKEKYLSLDKIIPMDNFPNHYKTVFLKKLPTRVVISLVSLICLKGLANICKDIILMNWIAFNMEKHVIKEMGSKVVSLAGFCHHCLTTMSAHTHAHHPLFESGMKTGFRMIALLSKHN